MLRLQPAGWRSIVAGLIFALAGTASAAAPSRQRHPGKLSAKARQDAKARGAANVDVLVRFRRNPGPAERSLVGALGGQVRRQHRSRWMAVRVPGRAVATLAENPAVEFVATDSPVTTAVDEVALATAGQPSADLPESALKGAGVTIAIVDSGVAAHPDIQTLVAAVDLVGTYDPSFAPEGSVDPDGHGTHVAGIMVGAGGEGRYPGVAPQASLVSIRVLDDTGRGLSSDMLAGLQWVLDHKDQYRIRVLNLSLGHPVYEPAEVDPLVQAVNGLWDAGIVVVCSAGNAGRGGHGTITSPCNSRKAITVGALNDHGTLDRADDTVTTYSSRGPTPIDLVAKPDLLAPGNRIESARAAGSHLDLMFPDSRVPGDPSHPEVLDHIQMSGTSMAAPFVAGAAALMLEQQPSLNPGTVKARLMLSARKVVLGDPFATGAGLLDIRAALQAAGEVVDAPSPLVFADSATGQLSFENTATLWSNPSFSLPALWSEAVLWSDTTQPDQPVLSSYAVLWPDATLWADATLWPEATLWPDATLWPESTLWSEAILWPDEAAVDVDISSLGTPVSDP